MASLASYRTPVVRIRCGIGGAVPRHQGVGHVNPAGKGPLNAFGVHACGISCIWLRLASATYLRQATRSHKLASRGPRSYAMPTRMETADQMARFVALLLYGDFAAVKIVLSGTWRSMLFLDGRVSADEKQRHLRPIAQQLGSGR